MRFLFLALILAVAVRATTVVPPNFDQLVGQSEVVFRGEVKAVSVVWTGEGETRRIATRVTFAVERVLHGTAGEKLTLEFMGGQLGGRRLTVAGLPQFAVGERGVFFVEDRDARLCPLLRLRHGRYRILKDESGVERIARDDGSPLNAIAAVQQPLAETAAAASQRALTLSAGLTLGAFEQAIVERGAQPAEKETK